MSLFISENSDSDELREIEQKEESDKNRGTAAILGNFQVVGQNILQSFRSFTQKK